MGCHEHKLLCGVLLGLLVSAEPNHGLGGGTGRILYHTEPTVQDCPLSFSINRPKDLLGCPAALEEFSFTAFLALFLFALLIVCGCVRARVCACADSSWQCGPEQGCPQGLHCHSEGRLGAVSPARVTQLGTFCDTQTHTHTHTHTHTRREDQQPRNPVWMMHSQAGTHKVLAITGHWSPNISCVVALCHASAHWCACGCGWARLHTFHRIPQAMR